MREGIPDGLFFLEGRQVFNWSAGFFDSDLGKRVPLCSVIGFGELPEALEEPDLFGDCARPCYLTALGYIGEGIPLLNRANRGCAEMLPEVVEGVLVAVSSVGIAAATQAEVFVSDYLEGVLGSWFADPTICVADAVGELALGGPFAFRIEVFDPPSSMTVKIIEGPGVAQDQLSAAFAATGFAVGPVTKGVRTRPLFEDLSHRFNADSDGY